jgi:hypothetical protein
MEICESLAQILDLVECKLVWKGLTFEAAELC